MYFIFLFPFCYEFVLSSVFLRNLIIERRIQYSSTQSAKGLFNLLRQPGETGVTKKTAHSRSWPS